MTSGLRTHILKGWKFADKINRLKCTCWIPQIELAFKNNFPQKPCIFEKITKPWYFISKIYWKLSSFISLTKNWLIQGSFSILIEIMNSELARKIGNSRLANMWFGMSNYLLGHIKGLKNVKISCKLMPPWKHRILIKSVSTENMFTLKMTCKLMAKKNSHSHTNFAQHFAYSHIL